MDPFYQSENHRPPPVRARKRVPRLLLPSKQRTVLDLVIRYYRATGEACPSTYIARQLDRHHSVIQGHFAELHRKGWLRTANSPATPTRS